MARMKGTVQMIIRYIGGVRRLARAVSGASLALAVVVGMGVAQTTGAQAATSTVAEFTYDLQDAYGGKATVRVELRKDGGNFWARATPSKIEGAGDAAVIGTLKLQSRTRTMSGGVWLAWSSWVTEKPLKFTVGDGQVSTAKYNPPNSTSTIQNQVRAALTASPEPGNPETQGTSGYTA